MAQSSWGHMRNMLLLDAWARIFFTFSALLSISMPAITAFKTPFPFSTTSHHSHGIPSLGKKAVYPSIHAQDMRCALFSNFQSTFGNSGKARCHFSNTASVCMNMHIPAQMKHVPGSKLAEQARERCGRETTIMMMCAREGEDTKKESKKKARDMSVAELRDVLLAEVRLLLHSQGTGCVCTCVCERDITIT
jgi:hypothetical protein